MTTAQVTSRPVAPVDGDELMGVCARHADELAGQVEAAERVMAAQLGQLARCEVGPAHVSAEWVAATLRVVADSLAELHSVLDETAARDAAIGSKGEF